MTVNSSIILMMEKNIPRAQVNIPTFLTLTPIFGAAGADSCQEDRHDQSDALGRGNQVYTVDVSIYGDTRELTELLRSEFPGAAITCGRPRRVSCWVVLSTGRRRQPHRQLGTRLLSQGESTTSMSAECRKSFCT